VALTNAIQAVRESVVAVFRYREVRQQRGKKGNPQPAQFNVSWGTGFCVTADRHVVTAFHVLNGGQPRMPEDRYLVFVVPANGEVAFHFPVVAFPLERPHLDLAILELGPPETKGTHIPAVPISLAPQADGTRVLTVGFPAPEVAGLNIDPQGNYRGGQFFLKSHANEGIVSAQYSVGSVLVYEFNVGWHHGESGGPVALIADPPAAFTVMQHYRNIQTPHGVVAGPHRGYALSTIQSDLSRLGATFV
jgi:hypothetical protein